TVEFQSRRPSVEEPEKSFPERRRLTMGRDAIFNVTLKRFLEPVGEYLDDDRVSEIMINGVDEIYIERHGMIEKTDACFEDDESWSRPRETSRSTPTSASLL